ncbi:MAG: PilT/PilU family type 4a pilus ATPase [bacterium]
MISRYAQAGIKLQDLLEAMFLEKASDLHITSGIPPLVRVNGHIRHMDYPPLTPEDTRYLAFEILSGYQRIKLKRNRELDFSFGINGLSRFRFNVYYQRGAIALAIRSVPFTIPSFQELNLPPVISELCERPRGLILISGPTGSGKSTTLAAMVEWINTHARKHIITVEDPIEYIHSHKGCMINQRELHSDTRSMARALRSVLREDPDVVMIGEMRDLETMEAALVISETGHLTLATLHTDSCVQSINRIIDVFPPHQQGQVRTQLSFLLEGILCQQLLPTVLEEGRVMALEILIPSHAIRNLIRESQIQQIYSLMQSGSLKTGMQTMNQALFTLYKSNLISKEIALGRSSYPAELLQLMQNSRL